MKLVFLLTVYVFGSCLKIACHPHLWQNDWGLLHVTVITQGVQQTLK